MFRWVQINNCSSCKIIVNTQVKKMSVFVIQNVSPGRMRACSASTPSLWPSSSHATALDIVTQASCVRRGSVLGLINIISTNGIKQISTNNNIWGKIIDIF